MPPKHRHTVSVCLYLSSEFSAVCLLVPADLDSHLVKIVSEYESELSKDLMNKDKEDERSFGYWTPSVGL